MEGREREKGEVKGGGGGIGGDKGPQWVKSI